VRRGGRPGRRAALVGGGVALMLGGAAALGIAIWPSGRRALPDPRATVIPAGVRTVAPTPASLPTARPMAASAPVRIEIPVLAVSAPVMRLGLSPAGTVNVPPLANHNLAGWYDRSVTPGQDGSAVLLGHVDSYTGISVFFFIKTLHPGDRIKIIRANGSAGVFAVDGVQRAAKVTFPTASVYHNTRYPALRLVTCGGPFDAASGQYLDNIIVYAHLVSAQRG
jgi:sortase (surface protein transpeptidase)